MAAARTWKSKKRFLHQRSGDWNCVVSLSQFIADLPENPRSRLAPTPSGFLHRGNAFNFLLTWTLVRQKHGTLHLRIDDLDSARRRLEYIEDIFESLGWLGIERDSGPRNSTEQQNIFSQVLRLRRYHDLIQKLIDQGHCFACTCSRTEIGPVYPGTCEAKNLALDEPGTSIRLRVQPDEIVQIKDRVTTSFAIGQETGSFVIRRKDGLPSYQIASVADDEDMQMNLIVRGVDLLPSTAMQTLIAEKAGLLNFKNTVFVHHSLITKDGEKLSKSAGAESLRVLRQGGEEAARRLCREFEVWANAL